MTMETPMYNICLKIPFIDGSSFEKAINFGDPPFMVTKIPLIHINLIIVPLIYHTLTYDIYKNLYTL